METKNYKTLKGVAFTVALLCAAHIVWLFVQTWFISGLGGIEGEINWSEDISPLQLTVLLGRLLFSTAYYATIIIFIAKTIKGLKSGIIFPQSNVVLLFTTAGCYFIGTLMSDNFDNILLTQTPDATYFAIESNTILITFIYVIFALLYKIAAKVSEENNLTI